MKKQSGYILIATLLIGGALLFFAFALVDSYTANSQIARMAETDIIAEQAASAGIDDAIYQLKRNPLWTAGFSAVTLPHSRATYSMSFDSSQTAIPFSMNNTLLINLLGYKGRIVLPATADLIAVGTCGSSQRTEEAMVLTLGLPLTLPAKVRSRW